MIFLESSIAQREESGSAALPNSFKFSLADKHKKRGSVFSVAMVFSLEEVTKGVNDLTFHPFRILIFSSVVKLFLKRFGNVTYDLWTVFFQLIASRPFL